ncbi:uncharacterized protein DFL_000479 [Arthrobotrys flagrans]|uniref:Uncharacterized protein n=1 Tax=Arthrobotrys flagrans TaxID=97331 RepID=A0A437ADZ9_ARTFL|nr:hypothetical protein DFL_000479 [Arthrobotrys flagrans]
MKSLATLSVIGALTLGAAAQQTNDTCPTTFSFDCPYICTYVLGTICSKTLWMQTGATGCRTCPGIPSTCPATWIEGCAYICKFGDPKADPFCSPSDTSNDGRRCTACPGKPPITATPAPTTGYNGNHTGSPTIPLPQPTYSSQASLVGISTAAFLGLLSSLLAM